MQDPLLGLIDYGSGNLRSVGKALTKIGARVELLASPERLAAMDAVVLPGVGAFGDCAGPTPRAGSLGTAGRLAARRPAVPGRLPGLPTAVRVERGNSRRGGVRPVRRGGAAFPRAGLEGAADRLEFLDFRQPGARLWRGLENGSHVYFVHSYHPMPVDPAWWQPRRTMAGRSPPPSSRATRWACSSTRKKARPPG